MDLICYAAADYPDRSTLLARLQAQVVVDRIVPCSTLDQLESSLMRPMSDVLAVVLFPADDADLIQIQTLHDVMTTTRIILVLPAWDPHLAMRAHSLRPRFMTSREKDLGEVGAVLRKMAGQFECSNTHCSGMEREGGSRRHESTIVR